MCQRTLKAEASDDFLRLNYANDKFTHTLIWPLVMRHLGARGGELVRKGYVRVTDQVRINRADSG